MARRLFGHCGLKQKNGFPYYPDFSVGSYNYIQLGRFAQADTIIPEQQQGTQAWDRFAYVNNNPLLYTQCTSLGILCRVVGKDEPFELLSNADAIGEQFFCL